MMVSFTFVVPLLGAACIQACSSSSSAGDDSGIATDSGSQTDSTTTTTTTTVTDSGQPIEAGVDAAVKKYCASDSVIVDAGPDAAYPPATPQQFDSKMAGCPGSVYWSDRATLCAASCTPCGAQDWILHHGNIAPTYDYWTNDNLGYGGEFEQGFACTGTPFPADAAAPQPEECESELPDGGEMPSPMRVCIDGDAATPYEGDPLDPIGNFCNWDKCAYETDLTVPVIADAGPDAAVPVFDHVGGCDDNPTAGTLCCCE